MYIWKFIKKTDPYFWIISLCRVMSPLKDHYSEIVLSRTIIAKSFKLGQLIEDNE